MFDFSRSLRVTLVDRGVRRMQGAMRLRAVWMCDSDSVSAMNPS